MAVDWDKVFKYKTFKVVNMIDMRLGLLNYAIMVAIILYIVLFVFWYSKGYLQEEDAIGQVELQVRGKSYFTYGGEHFLVDALDMTNPAIEHGALFVVSRMEMVKQRRGRCGNHFYQCDTNADCPKQPPIAEGNCVEGFCEEIGWCPPLDPTDPDSTFVMQYERPENLTIWIRAAITFPALDPEEAFTTMNDENPIYAHDNPELANAFYMSEFLEMAGIHPPSVKQDGCFLSIRMQWDCFLDTGAGCYSPELTVRRLDIGAVSGFEYYDGEYSRDPSGDPEKETRFFSKQIGYRMVVASKGTGYKTSIAAVMLNFSAGIALLGLSKTMADALMLYLLPEKAHYRKYKEQRTPDFSDLRDKIGDEDAEVSKLRSSAKASRYQKIFA